MKTSSTHIFSISFISATFLILNCYVATVFATEISELEEITMQVIESDSMENIEVQQMISIPSPLSTGAISHSPKNPEMTIQSQSKPLNRSQLENKKETPR